MGQPQGIAPTLGDMVVGIKIINNQSDLKIAGTRQLMTYA